MTIDLLILDVRVLDGSGAPGFAGDIAIDRGKVISTGTLKHVGAQRRINAQGLFACPGFIDIHAHGTDQLLVTPFAESKIMQGITTMVGGNCGISEAPIYGQLASVVNQIDLFPGVEVDWYSLAEFYERLENQGIAINVASLTGNANLRACVLGFDTRKPTEGETDLMKKYLEQSMREGAFGLSTGLVYAPSSFSDRDEIIKLAKVAAQFGGFYATHVRGMARPIVEAVNEALEISIIAGLPLQISHLNIGYPSWGKIDELLRLIDEKKDLGHDISMDSLLHIDSIFSGGSLLPAWCSAGGKDQLTNRLMDVDIRAQIKDEIRRYGDGRGGSVASCLMQDGKWEKLWVIEPSQYQMKTLARIASIRNEADPFDSLLDLIVESNGKIHGISQPYCQRDMDIVLTHPSCMPATDGLPVAPYGTNPPMHTREYGAFARLLSDYVRKRGVLSLEQAIRKSTLLPARRLGLKDRGIIREGYWADLVLFDFDRIEETGNALIPAQYPHGFEYVIINGEIVVDQGHHTHILPGKVLRHQVTKNSQQ